MKMDINCNGYVDAEGDYKMAYGKMCQTRCLRCFEGEHSPRPHQWDEFSLTATTLLYAMAFGAASFT